MTGKRCGNPICRFRPPSFDEDCALCSEEVTELNKPMTKRSIRWKVKSETFGWCFVWADSYEKAQAIARPRYEVPIGSLRFPFLAS